MYRECGRGDPGLHVALAGDLLSVVNKPDLIHQIRARVRQKQTLFEQFIRKLHLLTVNPPAVADVLHPTADIAAEDGLLLQVAVRAARERVAIVAVRRAPLEKRVGLLHGIQKFLPVLGLVHQIGASRFTQIIQDVRERETVLFRAEILYVLGKLPPSRRRTVPIFMGTVQDLADSFRDEQGRQVVSLAALLVSEGVSLLGSVLAPDQGRHQFLLTQSTTVPGARRTTATKEATVSRLKHSTRTNNSTFAPEITGCQVLRDRDSMIREDMIDFLRPGRTWSFPPCNE